MEGKQVHDDVDIKVCCHSYGDTKYSSQILYHLSNKSWDIKLGFTFCSIAKIILGQVLSTVKLS